MDLDAGEGGEAPEVLARSSMLAMLATDLCSALAGLGLSPPQSEPRGVESPFELELDAAVMARWDIGRVGALVDAQIKAEAEALAAHGPPMPLAKVLAEQSRASYRLRKSLDAVLLALGAPGIEYHSELDVALEQRRQVRRVRALLAKRPEVSTLRGLAHALAVLCGKDEFRRLPAELRAALQQMRAQAVGAVGGGALDQGLVGSLAAQLEALEASLNLAGWDQCARAELGSLGVDPARARVLRRQLADPTLDPTLPTGPQIPDPPVDELPVASKESGNAERHPLERLRDLMGATATGEFIVSSNSIEVHIFLQRGRLAWATTTGAAPAFRRFLLEQMQVDPEALDEAFRECKRSKRPFGEVLVSWGLASLSQVRQALRAQVESALAGLRRSTGAQSLFLPRGASFESYDATLTFGEDVLGA